MPITPNHSSSISIFVGLDRFVIPNLLAVTLPRTVTGKSARPSVMKRPSESFPPITFKSSELVTIVEIPPPSNSEIKFDRLTNKSVWVVDVTSSTGPILSTIPITPSGSSSCVPKKPAWGDAFTRFVPRDSRVESRSALPDAAIPETATIAAMPIPIPIDVKAALPFLAFTPYTATKKRSLVLSLFLLICLQLFHQLTRLPFQTYLHVLDCE